METVNTVTSLTVNFAMDNLQQILQFLHNTAVF